ncbi:MAG: AbrB/MazE/SpoVT family DNA-binding domain-containing protein [Chloroflexota bacterium]
MEVYATVKGQIVIPAELRRKYGIKEGTKIVVTDTENGINLRPITEQYIRELQGSLKGTGMIAALLEERAKDRAREDK